MSEFDLTGNAILSSTDKNPKTLSVIRTDTNSQNAGVTPFAEIQMSISGVNNDLGVLAFLTNNGSSNDERMRIDPTGNVGMGTTVPNHKLEVAKDIGSTGDDGQIVASGYTNKNKGLALGFDTVNNVGFIYAREKGVGFRNLVLGYPGGNVGIGKQGPNYPLSLGDGLANTKLAIWDGGSGGTAFGLGVQASQFRFHLNVAFDRFSFLNGAAGTEIVTFLGTGNVGIGTLTAGPTRKLEIAGSSGNVLWAGASTGSTANIDLSGHVQLREYGNGGIAYLQARDDASNRDIGLRIRTQSAGLSAPGIVEAVTIDKSGNVEVAGNLKANAIQSKPAIFDFKIMGNFSEFYPVVFSDNSWSDGPMILEINRPNVHTDSNWRGSLNSRFIVHSSAWGHGADMCRAEIYYGSNQFIAGYQNHYYSSKFIVWLKGGGTTYYFRSNHSITLEDFSATAKTLDGQNYPIKTSIDSYVLASGIHFDKSLVIDGKVGIGTNVPQSKLQVKSLTAIDEGATGAGAWANFGSNAFYDGVWKRIDSTKAGVNLHINSDGGGQEFRFYRVEANGTNQRNIAVIGSSISYMLESNVGIGTSNPAANLDVAGGGKLNQVGIGSAPFGTLPYPYESIQLPTWANLRINFGSTETAIFTNNGYVGIGVIPSEKLHVAGAFIRVDGAGNEQAYIGGDAVANDVQIGSFNPAIMSVAMWNTSAGWMNVAARNFITKSDLRYKKNIQGITNALDTAMRLHGVIYDHWNHDSKDMNLDGRRQIGFIGQEVKEILPDVVFQDSKGYYGISYTSIIPLLVEAMKEQQKMIEELKEKIR